MNDVTTTPPPAPERSHRRPWPRWLTWPLTSAAYIAGFMAASAVHAHLNDLTLLAYAVAEIGGAAFIVRYWRTDWRSHPWGRHVMAFMVCMEILFTLALSRRAFGDWPGLQEVLFLASVTFAGIVWWRYRLLVLGGRRLRPGADD